MYYHRLFLMRLAGGAGVFQSSSDLDSPSACVLLHAWTHTPLTQDHSSLISTSIAVNISINGNTMLLSANKDYAGFQTSTDQ